MSAQVIKEIFKMKVFRQPVQLHQAFRAGKAGIEVDEFGQVISGVLKGMDESTHRNIILIIIVTVTQPSVFE